MPRRRIVHTLKLGLTGHPAPLCLRISKREAQRFERDLRAPDPRHPFFRWDCPSGATIAIALKDVQFANILWDLPENVAPEPTLPDTDRLDVRLRHRPALGSGVAHPLEAFSLIATLAVGHLADDFPEFLEFQDEDDERLWFRSDQLVYLSVPKWMMDAARQAVEDECEAEAAAEAARMERTTAADRLILETGGLPPRRSTR